MQKFLVGWIIMQLMVIGISSASIDNHRASNNTPVDCSSVDYKVGVTIIDVSVPLLQFSDLSTKDCATGTAQF